jgi:hypothetical protein
MLNAEVSSCMNPAVTTSQCESAMKSSNALHLTSHHVDHNVLCCSMLHTLSDFPSRQYLAADVQLQ